MGSSFQMERLAVNWPIGKVLKSSTQVRLQALGKPEVAPYINPHFQFAIVEATLE